MRRPTLFLGLTIALLLSGTICARAGIVCYQYEYAPNLVRAVQMHLKEQGLYKGRVDGKWGPQTEGAVFKFQEKNRLLSTWGKHDDPGQLGKRTLEAMFGEDIPPGVAASPDRHSFPGSWWSRHCE